MRESPPARQSRGGSWTFVLFGDYALGGGGSGARLRELGWLWVSATTTWCESGARVIWRSELRLGMVEHETSARQQSARLDVGQLSLFAALSPASACE